MIRDARPDDAAIIAEIYNAGIADGGATFETLPRSVADIEMKVAAAARFPLVVADEQDRVRGWAGVSEYRSRACYAGIGEFSFYVARDARGRGLGQQLLNGLVDAARDAGYWKLVSRVFPDNAASLAACRAAGFREAGRYEKHAFNARDGCWQDVIIVERLIPENQSPTGLRFRHATDADWPAIAALLTEAHLPLAGARESLQHFVLALREDDVVGCATVEAPAGSDAVLLRSVALIDVERGTGAGRWLVDRAIARAARDGARTVILLTTTAEAFFAHLGFTPITRADVPAALLSSPEFTGACPERAAIMRKTL